MSYSHGEDTADGSVTRSQPTLGTVITPGNWGQYPIGEKAWNGFSLKRCGTMLPQSPKDGATADQVVGEVMAHQAYNRYGP